MTAKVKIENTSTKEEVLHVDSAFGYGIDLPPGHSIEHELPTTGESYSVEIRAREKKE